jgi:hypothetical protein
MTPFAQSIVERIKRLDAHYAEDKAGRAERDAAYTKHRSSLLTTLACETGGDVSAEPIAKELEPGNQWTNHLMAGSGTPISVDELNAHNQKTHLENKTQLMIVVDAVGRMQGPFDKDAVIKQIEAGNLRGFVTPNTVKNISSFLWRLRNEGLIKIQEKGSGHRQSVYEKANT